MIYIRSSLVELDPQPNAFGSGMLSRGSPEAACELQGIVTHPPGSGSEGLSLGHFRPQRRQRSLILGLRLQEDECCISSCLVPLPPAHTQFSHVRTAAAPPCLHIQGLAPIIRTQIPTITAPATHPTNMAPAKSDQNVVISQQRRVRIKQTRVQHLGPIIQSRLSCPWNKRLSWLSLRLHIVPSRSQIR
jgi:hypothetical protein